MLLKNTPVPAVNFNRAARKILTPVLIVFFLIGVFQPLYSLIKILLKGQLFDFNFTYMRAAEAFLSGVNIYTFGDINYPPTALFLFIPFYLIPVFYSQIIFSLISLACLILAIFLTAESLNWRFSKKEFLLLFPLVFLSFPVKWTFGMGQMNNLILLLVVAAYFFSKKGKDIYSGLVLGLAISLKIVPILLLSYFLINRKYKIVLASILSSLLFFLLAGWAFGFNLIFEYFLKVVPMIFGQPGKSIYYNQAFSGFVDRVGLNQIFVWIFLITVLVITFYSFIKRTKDNSLGFSLILSATLLINTFSWQHHFVWLIFPYLSAWYFLKKKRLGLTKLLLVVSYLLVAFNIKQPGMMANNIFSGIIMSHVFSGNFLLWLILLYISWYYVGDE